MHVEVITFQHWFIIFVFPPQVLKKGPTPIGVVALNIDIPVNTSDGHKLVKLYPPKVNASENTTNNLYKE